MKASSVFLAIILLLRLNLAAQVPVFDLSKYARPTLNRQSLDLGLHLTGGQYDVLGSTRATSNLGGDFNLAYLSFHNSPEAQKSSSIYLELSPYRNTNSSDLSKAKVNRLNGRLAINSTKLKYAKKNTFIGYQLNLQYRNNSINQYLLDLSLNTPQISDDRDSDHQLTLDLPLTVGKGRIEQVEDARHGLFILQALEKRQYLAREIREEDILDFAAHISELKNRRYFDFRLQKIWELEQLHDFLRKRGIIEAENIGYFAMVQDIWSFGNQAIRRVGSRIRLGVNPHLQLGRDRNLQKDFLFNGGRDTVERDRIRDSYNFRPGFYMDFFHEKSLSESWQERFQILTEVGISRRSITRKSIFNGNESRENSQAWDDTPFIRAYAYYTLAFYPNTRSYFEGSFGSSYYHSKSERGFNTLLNYSSLATSLRLNAYYYLSPQTRLTFTCSSTLGIFADRSPFDGNSSYLYDLITGGNVANQVHISLSHAWF
ncbi:MAG: hypothetical protein AAF696_34340 [Bacteroidota bacterium]